VVRPDVVAAQPPQRQALLRQRPPLLGEGISRISMGMKQTEIDMQPCCTLSPLRRAQPGHAQAAGMVHDLAGGRFEHRKG
jgi:hypothetical protein